MQFKTPFVDLYEELSVLQEIVAVPIQSAAKSDFEKAKACAEDFVNTGGWIVRPETIKGISTTQDLINIAFSAPHLARYYEQNTGDPEKITNLVTLLDILGYKLKNDPKSLQYLYHAVVQEHYLITDVAPDTLVRNPSATKARTNGESAYWYLFSDGSSAGIKTSAPDFIFNKKYTIDAKIYGSYSKMQSKLNKDVAHDANFVIVYLIGSKTWWFMYKANDNWEDWAQTNGAKMYTDPAINALAQKVYQLDELYFRYKI